MSAVGRHAPRRRAAPSCRARAATVAPSAARRAAAARGAPARRARRTARGARACECRARRSGRWRRASATARGRQGHAAPDPSRPSPARRRCAARPRACARTTARRPYTDGRAHRPVASATPPRDGWEAADESRRRGVTSQRCRAWRRPPSGRGAARRDGRRVRGPRRRWRSASLEGGEKGPSPVSPPCSSAVPPSAPASPSLSQGTPTAWRVGSRCSAARCQACCRRPGACAATRRAAAAARLEGAVPPRWGRVPSRGRGWHRARPRPPKPT